MLAALTMAAALFQPTCDPVGGPRTWPLREAKAETRARINAVYRDRGAIQDVRTFVDVITVRESFGGHAGVRHDQGRGLGPMGLMLSAHHDKWPGVDDAGKRGHQRHGGFDDEDPMFCSPEVSALVAHDILRRAMLRWGADDFIGLQSVYAGRHRTIVLEDGTWLRTPGRTLDPGLCARLSARGVDCRRKLQLKDLGRRVRYVDRRAKAEQLHRDFKPGK